MQSEVRIREIQSEDRDEVSGLYIRVWHEEYRNIFSSSVLKNFAIESRKEVWESSLTAPSEDQQTFVAEYGPQDKIVGFINGGRSDLLAGYEWQMYRFYVDSKFRGMGIGGELFGSLSDWLNSNGADRFFCRILEANPHRRFYEKYGGSLLSKKFTKRFNDEEYPIVVYAWAL